jgi:hypothetical protein
MYTVFKYSKGKLRASRPGTHGAGPPSIVFPTLNANNFGAIAALLARTAIDQAG